MFFNFTGSFYVWLRRKDWYQIGYSDGYATGYNTTCNIRATLIHGSGGKKKNIRQDMMLDIWLAQLICRGN